MGDVAEVRNMEVWASPAPTVLLRWFVGNTLKDIDRHLFYFFSISQIAMSWENNIFEITLWIYQFLSSIIPIRLSQNEYDTMETRKSIYHFTLLTFWGLWEIDN